MAYQDIVVDVVDGVSTITINRPDNANKLRFQTARELLDALRIARETSTSASSCSPARAASSSASGVNTRSSASLDYSSVMPVIDLYEFIDTMPKPVIAAVTAIAVGGGNVLHVVCDLAVAGSARRIPPGRPDGRAASTRDTEPGIWKRPLAANAPRRCGT